MIKNDINLQKLKNAINECKPPALKAGEQLTLHVIETVKYYCLVHVA